MGYTNSVHVTLHCDAVPRCIHKGLKKVFSAGSLAGALAEARSWGWKIAVNRSVGVHGMGRALCPKHAGKDIHTIRRTTRRTDGMPPSPVQEELVLPAPSV